MHALQSTNIIHTCRILLMIYKSRITLRALNYGNYGLFPMGNAGFTSSTVFPRSPNPKYLKMSVKARVPFPSHRNNGRDTKLASAGPIKLQNKEQHEITSPAVWNFWPSTPLTRKLNRRSRSHSSTQNARKQQCRNLSSNLGYLLGVLFATMDPHISGL